MSRILAQILGAAEPGFKQQISRLESAAGLPAADIRLMISVVNETRDKIRELGLDPHDTTGPELFHALQVRLREDEARVRESLGIAGDARAIDVLRAVQHCLEKQKLESDSLVIKPAMYKALLKKLQPKATMKKLGYRSMESMLKHEPVPQLLAATMLCESHEWHQHRLQAYKKFQANDFEIKRISLLVPSAKQWPKLAAKHIGAERNNLLTMTELGAIVLLPMEENLPAFTITTLLLTVNAMNDIRACSSYLKLNQVRPDFGTLVQGAMLREPTIEADLTGQPLPWKVVQWFYGHGYSAYHPDVFEPHVQPEDLRWHDAEALLASIHPALEFWKGSQLLALLDNKAQPVSLNLLDVALSVCNGLDYGQRVVRNVRENLWRELLARYLHQENLQNLLLGRLDQQLVPEMDFEA